MARAFGRPCAKVPKWLATITRLETLLSDGEGLPLVESKAFPGGGVHLAYDNVGKPEYGDVLLPSPS